jgi:rhodanese-related sulfurtransferase
MSSYTSISPEKLSALTGTANAPTLVGVRVDEHFAADPRLIPGATRRSYPDVQGRAPGFTGRSIVVICHPGGKRLGSAMDYGAAAAKYADIHMQAIKWDHDTKLHDAYSKKT